MLNFIRWGSYYEDYWYSFKSNLVTVTLGMMLAYVNIYFLYPKFILKKKYIKYVIYFTIALFIFYAVRTELIYLFINENVWPESQTLQRAYSFNHLVVVFLIGIYDVALITTIKITTDWILERKRTEELQEIQLRTELNFLKSQIQPHFFFNTLNNLYALALEKSDDAPRLIIKLSNLMQYVLYEVNSSKASLLEEINHLNNYIDIEHIRFKDRIEFEMDITGVIEDVEVPPLLLLTFVENCFKHGLKKRDKIKIRISFEVTNDGYLEFKIANSFNPNINDESKSGIGLKNAERRLNLLFDKNFTLKSYIENNSYNLFLKIPVK